jgi:hypothetical protein
MYRMQRRCSATFLPANHMAIRRSTQIVLRIYQWGGQRTYANILLLLLTTEHITPDPAFDLSSTYDQKHLKRGHQFIYDADRIGEG